MVSRTQGLYWALGASDPRFTPGYSGGRLSFNGGFVAGDLLFREGIGVPEPTPATLLALGSGIILAVVGWNKARRRRTVQA
jgi:hypothetical protein